MTGQGDVPGTAPVDSGPDPVRLLDGYPGTPIDEATHPEHGVDPRYPDVLAVLDAVGAVELAERTAAEQAARAERGVLFVAMIDGRRVDQPFPLDLVPRVIDAQTWGHLAAGAEQRARALNAFLADVYGDASDSSSEPAIVAAGLVPAALVRAAPGYRPDGVGLVGRGLPRAVLYGLDLLADADGKFVVLEDNLQVPSGLAYALANRDSLLAAVPELGALAADVHDPAVAIEVLGGALRSCAPPNCPRPEPAIVLLSDGPDNSAWYEHRTLATLLEVPIVGADDLFPHDGGIGRRAIDGAVEPVDVIYRRFGHDDLTGDSPLGALLLTAARAGRLTVCNAPGNGVADDKAIYAFVGSMIRFYLGEEPLLDDVGTWVLADPRQYAAVRGRMDEVVVKPVDGSGGAGVMIGPDLSAAQVADLEQTVADRPQGYIAQDVVEFSTHPTLVPSDPPVLRPRRVDLRLFVISGPAGPVAVPAALSRVARDADGLLVNSSAGGGSKDTWIFR
jgi:carboxylate-amine ligase